MLRSWPTKVLFLLFFHTGTAQSAPLIEKYDEFEIDWTNQKIRYNGYAYPSANEFNLPDLEVQAWNNGLLMAVEKSMLFVRKILTLQSIGEKKIEQLAQKASHRLSTTTYAIETIYGADGGVKVLLENRLSRLLRRNDIIHEPPTNPEANTDAFSGLLIRMSTQVRPVGNFKIVDEMGKTVYSPETTTKKAYERKLMGIWTKNPSRREILKLAGSKPISVQARQVKVGVLEVSRSSWDKIFPSSIGILKNADVVILVP